MNAFKTTPPEDGEIVFTAEGCLFMSAATLEEFADLSKNERAMTLQTIKDGIERMQEL